MGHIGEFCGLKFDTLKIKIQLLKNELDKVIEKVKNVFKEKKFTTH